MESIWACQSMNTDPLFVGLTSIIKTQKFQRSVYAGDGNLEDKVNAFFSELAKPYEFVVSGAAIDTDVANEPQYTDVPERLGVMETA